MGVVAMQIISATANSIHANSSWQPHTNFAGNTFSQYDDPAFVDMSLVIAFTLICIALAIYIIREYKRINTKRPTPMSMHNNEYITLPTTHDEDDDDTYNPYDQYKSPKEYAHIPIRDEEYYAE